MTIHLRGCSSSSGQRRNTEKELPDGMPSIQVWYLLSCLAALVLYSAGNRQGIFNLQDLLSIGRHTS